MEYWEMSTDEKLEAAGLLKEQGNTLFKAKDFAEGAKLYHKVCTPTF
eukprot:SAG11_NODE_5805_length_1460_cov_1.194710_1_plen_47_part_00